MINPVSSSSATHASQVSQQAVRQPQPQQSNTRPPDTVSLKSTGDIDHDGDSK
jgi:hypothetical protein